MDGVGDSRDSRSKPGDALPGLAGVEVPDDVRRAVLDDVERWASDVFGGLDQAVDSQEAYVLTPLRLPVAERAPMLDNLLSELGDALLTGSLDDEASDGADG